MKQMSPFKGLVIALALAASAIPAQAAPMGWWFDNDRRFPMVCLTDYQIRQRIAAAGFTNIYLNAPIERHIQVRATKDGWVYLIDFNFCTARIVSMRPLRRAS